MKHQRFVLLSILTSFVLITTLSIVLCWFLIPKPNFKYISSPYGCQTIVKSDKDITVINSLSDLSYYLSNSNDSFKEEINSKVNQEFFNDNCIIGIRFYGCDRETYGLSNIENDGVRIEQLSVQSFILKARLSVSGISADEMIFTTVFILSDTKASANYYSHISFMYEVYRRDTGQLGLTYYPNGLYMI